MIVQAITIKNHSVSENAFENLKNSSKTVGNLFEIQRFDAITPVQNTEKLQEFGIRWNYPWLKDTIEPKLNIVKTPYTTKNKDTKIACALSHYALWKKAKDTNRTILILEHDAEFTTELSPYWMNLIEQSVYQFIGINSPIGATRKAISFHESIQNTLGPIVACPWIDKKTILQGLAGGSAYVVKPHGAVELLSC